MRHKVMRVGLVLVMTALLTGCFSTSWLIGLNEDGSGTIDMEYRLDKSVLDMMDSFGGEGKKKTTTSEDLIKQQDLEKLAGQLGEGVRFVSAEPLPEENGRLGFTAQFEFDDISKVGLDPMEGAPEQDSQNVEADEQSVPPYTFQFTQGSPAALVIKVAQENGEATEGSSAEEQSESGDESGGQDQEMMTAMMKPYLRNMSFRVQVKIDGTISKTDAAYRDGSTITLMDMDMGKIIDNETLFKKVMNSDQAFKDKEMLKQLEKEGIRIEPKEEVTVQFR